MQKVVRAAGASGRRPCPEWRPGGLGLTQSGSRGGDRDASRIG
jgi:hypothetical protein